MSGEAPAHGGEVFADGKWRWDGTTWQPAAVDLVSQPAPQWLSVKLQASATWLTLGGALIVGLIAAQALRPGVFGLAASLTIAITAFVLIFAGRLLTFESRVLAAAAALFAAWLTMRASPW